MRLIVLLAAIAAMTGIAAADDGRGRAKNAAGIFAALAYECDEHTDEDLKAIARADALLTLEAGGYDPGERTALVELIFNELDSKWQPTGLPPAMCAAMTKSTLEGREKFRADLASGN